MSDIRSQRSWKKSLLSISLTCMQNLTRKAKLIFWGWFTILGLNLPYKSVSFWWYWWDFCTVWFLIDSVLVFLKPAIHMTYLSLHDISVSLNEGNAVGRIKRKFGEFLHFFSIMLCYSAEILIHCFASKHTFNVSFILYNTYSCNHTYLNIYKMTGNICVH